ncbi:6-phospho-3-hexuloisomerase [Gilliamella sp. Pas-s25]|uniref:6-phospho-3-hexuloisomerase n=1 Tax=Gilliamella sp. Pas-s25 TaxID=2687310 RepID=UPI00135D996B|nr:6-phospho-3-hexuloisomerase [Gilliamella sp. Pas-s25]MWP60988.1 SIS domain-containing protein [Gilliamella sp. Pas-s25]
MQSQLIIDELNRSVKTLTEQNITNLIQKIQQHNRIFVYGTGRSGLMLKALAMRLMQLGLNAFVVGETTTPSTKQGDLLIVASASGETNSVNMIAESALKQTIDLAIICASPNSTLAKIQTPDIILQSGNKYSTSQISQQPLGSLFEQMLLVIFDTVILTMSNQQKGSNDDMAHRHASLE